MCEDNVSIDVSHENHRRAAHLGNRHVDQFPMIGVDLARAARALIHHDVRLRPEACKAATHDPKHPGPSGPVFTEPHPSPETTSDDHLGTEVGFGLEKHRVPVGSVAE